MANLLYLSLTLVLLLKLVAAEGKFGTNARQLDTLAIETGQLERRRITLNLCKNIEDLRDVGQNETPGADNRIALAGSPPDSPEPKLECADNEKIALVSLEDLTFAKFPLLFNSSRQPETVSHMVADLCTLKGLKLSADTLQVAKEEGSDWRTTVLYESCCRLLDDHRSGFANLNELCNNSSHCSPTSADWFPADTTHHSRGMCTRLARARLRASVRLEYVCQPLKSSFVTRRVAYRDLTNAISCSPDSLLYVKRTSWSIEVADIQVNEVTQPCHDKCNSNAVPDSKRAASKLNQNDDYETEVELYINQTTDSPGSPTVQNLFHDLLTQNGVQLKRPVLQTRLSRTKRNATNNQSDCPVEEVILALCHARAACLVSLSKVLQGLQKKGRCYIGGSDLARSFAEIDYACIKRPKFEPTNQLSVVHASYKTSTNRTYTREVQNGQDYDRQPTYISELGNVAFEEPDTGNKSDDLRGAQRSGVGRLNGSLVCLVATAWITYKLYRVRRI